VKAMFKWAVANGYIKENPFANAKKFKVENIRIRWLDNSEIPVILTECTKQGDLDLRDILVFALHTGFRKGNLERVTAHDVNNQRISAVRTKSGKAYEVPISNDLGKLLERLMRLRPSGPLLNFKNFRRRFDAVIKDPSVTLHTFRHTFAAQCLKAGVPIDRVCKWLGHHSMEFTRSHYGHLSPNQEQIEINLLNLGGKAEIKESGETKGALW
jgi:integrase/recombinase XerD